MPLACVKVSRPVVIGSSHPVTVPTMPFLESVTIAMVMDVVHSNVVLSQIGNAPPVRKFVDTKPVLEGGAIKRSGALKQLSM